MATETNLSFKRKKKAVKASQIETTTTVNDSMEMMSTTRSATLSMDSTVAVNSLKCSTKSTTYKGFRRSHKRRKAERLKRSRTTRKTRMKKKR